MPAVPSLAAFLTGLDHMTLGYIVINLNPIALGLGSFQIHWYGLAYVLAISVALTAILRYADGLGVPRAHIWNIFLWAALAGLVGGRLYYVIQQPDLVEHFIKEPINIIAVWNGGMAYFGAIFLATPTAAYMAWRAGLSPWLAMDLGALFGAVGQMFGRLGNLVNGDIVGYAAGHPAIPSTVCATAPCLAYVNDPKVLPWAMAYLNPGSFVAQFGVPYQPAAAYEILWNLTALALLWPLRFYLPRKVRAGAFFSLYVALYSVSQIVIFFARSNIFVTFLGISTLKQAQWTGLFTLLGIMLFYFVVVQRFGQTWDHDPEHPLPPPPGSVDPVPVAAGLASVTSDRPQANHPSIAAPDHPADSQPSGSPTTPNGSEAGTHVDAPVRRTPPRPTSKGKQPMTPAAPGHPVAAEHSDAQPVIGDAPVPTTQQGTDRPPRQSVGRPPSSAPRRRSGRH